jgi:hypothetical protein
LQKIEDYNLTKQKYFESIQLFKKKKLSETKFYMQLNSIKNFIKKKKKKKLLVAKNRGLQLNQAKILRM